MAEEIIKVRVIARQVVHYKQTLSFTREDWEEFKAMDEREAGDAIGDRLDLRKIYDADQIEEFEADVVGDDGSPVKPADSYAQ